MKTGRFLTGILGVSLAAFACTSAYGQKKIKVIKPKPEPAAQPAQPESSEPDKVLYERAMTDLKKRHYIEERLSLQTLINTYPDSEYLAKAKLGVADSYYLEGGASNYAEAISEYKSFIVFFPFLDEAAYAQMQVAMAHYRMMEKADRDNSEAQSAEAEFQTFLLKYPDSKLVPQAQQRLRDVQEVIADAAFKVARFYYLRPDYRASAARLVELTTRYPLYSQSDEVLWMLGSIYDVAKKNSKNEDDKNHWADLAAKCYDQIVTNYPLSARAPLAQERLKEMGMAVPAADPAAVQRMKQQIAYEKAHHQSALVKGPVAMIRSGPDFSVAARSGNPNLSPPQNAISATDILNPGAAGPSFNLAAKNEGLGTQAGPIVGAGAIVPGTGASADPQADSDVGGHQIFAAPTTASVPSDSAGGEEHTGTVNAPTTGSTPVAAVASDTTTPNNTAQADPPADSGSAQADDSSTQASSNPSATTAPPLAKNESSSKKKKGLGKLNPF